MPASPLPPRLRLAAVAFALWGAAVPAVAQGAVVAIGGGARPPGVVAAVVALGGGPDGRLVVVPYASADPEGVGRAQADEFRAAGFGHVAVALGPPDADSALALFDGATAVFFSGGDQNRLVRALRGTRALDAVRAVWARGGVVAGTSAGAAVMSRVMITGGERVRPDSAAAPFSTVEPGNVETDEGFGFVTGAVLDQHFAARRRQNRLLSLVLERPDLLGVGVDEETAVVVAADGSFRVIGNRSVQVFDARGASVETRGRGFSAAGVRLHVLAAGDGFTAEREVLRGASPGP
jgi:cyanophycinase